MTSTGGNKDHKQSQQQQQQFGSKPAALSSPRRLFRLPSSHQCQTLCVRTAKAHCVRSETQIASSSYKGRQRTAGDDKSVFAAFQSSFVSPHIKKTLKTSDAYANTHRQMETINGDKAKQFTLTRHVDNNDNYSNNNNS